MRESDFEIDEKEFLPRMSDVVFERPIRVEFGRWFCEVVEPSVPGSHRRPSHPGNLSVGSRAQEIRRECGSPRQ